MRNKHFGLGTLAGSLVISLCCWCMQAADVTYFSYSDIHFGADNGGKSAPKEKSEMVDVINSLSGVEYPAAIGGVVGKPRGLVMQGDLINDGAVAAKYPTQWANYVADFGVNGEGRCKVPVFEGVGNHDLHENLFVFNQVKARNVIRKDLKLINNVSPNGYHYSWDWDEVHFINLNLFAGNVWEGEADAYGYGHHPQFARDFLVEDLKKNVGNTGRPVVVIQHFRPIDENWWTYSAADKFHKVLQDYNVIVIMVGHQGGGVNNVWRGINWASSNGELDVYRISPDNKLSIVSRSSKGWGTPLVKPIYLSYATCGLPAVVNNGDWATSVSATGATLSGKILYEAASPTQVKLYWGTTDGGAKADAWQNSKDLGVKSAGDAFAAEITGLKPWTQYYYRCQVSNSKGDTWAAASIPFTTSGVLPAGWQTAFIGFEQRPWGGATESNGTFTVKGSSRDVYEPGQKIDNCQYAYKELEGDGEIKARIATMAVNSREPKVGVMLRETLEKDSRSASLLLCVPGGVRFCSRSSVGGASSVSKGVASKAPCWVKLVRSGNVITGFTSGDGEAWTQVGSEALICRPRCTWALRCRPETVTGPDIIRRTLIMLQLRRSQPPGNRRDGVAGCVPTIFPQNRPECQ